MKTVKIGFLGMGNVGSGAYAILKNNAPLIEEGKDCALLLNGRWFALLIKHGPTALTQIS